MNQIVHLHYTEHKSFRSIAKQMGIHKTQVERYLNRFKKEHFDVLVRDFRTHKRLFEKMVELLIQSQHRRQELWRQYENITKEYEVIFKRVINCRELIMNDKLSQLVDDRMFNLTLKMITKRTQILNMLRRESQAVVGIYWRYGLTGKDASKVIMPNGIDIEEAIEQVKEFLSQMHHIVVQEVGNPEQRQKVISRIQDEVDKAEFLHDEEEEEIKEVRY